MTEAMPFLRNTILLSYDTHSLRAGVFCAAARGSAGFRQASRRICGIMAAKRL